MTNYTCEIKRTVAPVVFLTSTLNPCQNCSK